MEFILLLCSVLVIFLLIKDILIHKNLLGIFDNIPISHANQVWFAKLRKEYLNKLSRDDLLQFGACVFQYINERENNNENKKLFRYKHK